MNQTVTRLTFDERDFLWHVETESRERYTARFVIDTSGVLANPHIPHIKGAETFRGPIFHSGCWDHSVANEGKRVGVIGSGCSGAQIVPAIAGKVSRLTLFMGKAQWILPRSDRQYGAAERFVRTLPGIRHIIRLLVFVFYDVRFVAFRRYPGTSGLSRFIKGHYRRSLKKQLDIYIKDDKLREHMMPDFELGCRRVIPTNTYLPALSLQNVDVDISGIECITPQAIRTKDGKDYIVQAICAVKRNSRIKAIDARRDLQDAYVADMRRKMQQTVWQNATCTAFYRKNMTEEVTSLSPEPVTRFILSRKGFRLSDYHLLK